MAKRPTAPSPSPPLLRPEGTAPKVSPLVLCDHLIAVAQEADRAGYPSTAAGLVALVNRMFDAPSPRH
jgi:hypothetical protein